MYFAVVVPSFVAIERESDPLVMSAQEDVVKVSVQGNEIFLI